MFFFGAAIWVTVSPPNRTVALANCANAGDGCLVSVDSDTATIATALAALGAATALIGLLGVRFTSVKAAGLELASFVEKTVGLPAAEPQTEATETPSIVPQRSPSPIRVGIVSGLGTELGVVPVAITTLDREMSQDQAPFLRDYQGAIRKSHRGWFVTHILGPATQDGQRFAVAIKLIPHQYEVDDVASARFYLGRAWGHQVFEGKRGPDRNFGIATEAYGPFLALCEIQFANGDRLLFEHYCDFEMGHLVSR